MKTTLEIALTYVRRGFSIMPLIPNTKRPAIKTWEQFQKRQPTETEIERWFTWWPNSGIGLITGKVSGCIALDIDGEQAGNYVLERGGLPITPTNKTSRGWHLLFEYPGFHVPNRVGFLEHLDIRGDGGQIAVYPTIHPSGYRYRWSIPTGQAFAPIPTWLMEFIKPQPKPTTAYEYGPQREIRYKTLYGQRALESEANEVSKTVVGRNDRLFRAALKMGSLIADQKIDRNQVERVLFSAAVSNGYTDKDGEAQAQRTIESGINIGMRSPRSASRTRQA